jgi:hypothetical protein
MTITISENLYGANGTLRGTCIISTDGCDGEKWFLDTYGRKTLALGEQTPRLVANRLGQIAS